MASLRTIECADCGAPRKTRKANTKYCAICRLIRDLKYIDKATQKCIVCDNRFAPLQRGEEVCGKCDLVPAYGDPRGKCALCETDDARLVNKDVNVCRECSTDPEKRTLLRRALILKQQKIIKGEVVIEP